MEVVCTNSYKGVTVATHKHIVQIRFRVKGLSSKLSGTCALCGNYDANKKKKKRKKESNEVLGKVLKVFPYPVVFYF